MQSFNPWTGDRQPCWWCTSYVRMLSGGAHAQCGRGGGVAIVAMPRHGCAFYSREPGADDEPGPPPCAIEPGSPVQGFVQPVKPVEWAP